MRTEGQHVESRDGGLGRGQGLGFLDWRAISTITVMTMSIPTVSTYYYYPKVVEGYS